MEALLLDTTKEFTVPLTSAALTANSAQSSQCSRIVLLSKSIVFQFLQQADPIGKLELIGTITLNVICQG